MMKVDIPCWAIRPYLSWNMMFAQTELRKKRFCIFKFHVHAFSLTYYQPGALYLAPPPLPAVGMALPIGLAYLRGRGEGG